MAFDPVTGDLPATPGGGRRGQSKAGRRKMLIYAGVGGVLLLVFLLSRRQSAAQAQAAPQTTAAYTPASDGVSGGGDGSGGSVDNSAQLASFQSALLDQLPQVIQSSIQAGIANGLPDPSGAAGDASTEPSGSASSDGLASTLGALAAFNVSEAQLFRGTGAGGQQKAAAGTHARAPHNTPKRAPHPAAHRAPKRKAPAPAHHVPNHPTGRAHKRHG